MKKTPVKKEEKSLNKLVQKFSINDVKYEIDELLDFKDYAGPDTHVFHLFRVDGSPHGLSIGGDFVSKDDAKQGAIEDYEENFA